MQIGRGVGRGKRKLSVLFVGQAKNMGERTDVSLIQPLLLSLYFIHVSLLLSVSFEHQIKCIFEKPIVKCLGIVDQ